MKHFNNLRLLTSFREISTVLEIIAKAMRIFTFVLVISRPNAFSTAYTLYCYKTICEIQDIL